MTAVEKSPRSKLNSVSAPICKGNILFQEKLEDFLFELCQSILA